MEKLLLSEMTGFLERQSVAGMTASIVTGQGQSFHLAAGYADKATGVAMTPAHRMLAGSVGKTFTATTALALHWQGILDIDAPISRWLGGVPWFARLANHDRLTLRKLLNHTSGVPDHRAVPDFMAMVRKAFSRSPPDADLYLTPSTLVGFVLDRPPQFSAVADFAYCETNYILAGMVIEAAAARSFYDLVDELFLSPLQLVETEPASHRDLACMAQGYSTDWDMGFPAEALAGGRMAYNPATEWAGGGYVSTSSDLMHWASSLYGDKVLPPPGLAALRDAKPIGNDDDLKISYGLGSYIWEGPWGRAVGHTGEAPGYRSIMLYLENRCLALGMQVNSSISTTADFRDFAFKLASTAADF